MRGVVCWAVLSLALAVSSSAEVIPLGYRLSPNMDKEVGDVGGGGSRLGTVRLTNMPVPETVVAEKQFFGRAMNNCALVLDKSTTEADYYDVLWLDSNRNNTFEENERFALPRQGRRGDEFITVPVVITTKTGSSTQNFKISAQSQDKNAYVRYSNSGYYLSRVKFGEKSHLVALVDTNANGRFDDKTVVNRDGDRILIDFNDDGKFENYYQRESEVAYVGKYLYVDNVYYGCQVAQDGSSLTLTQPEIALGTLQVEEPNVALLLSGPDGRYRYVREEGNGPFSVPVGNYVVQQATVSRKGDDGVLWSLRSDSARGPAVKIEEGKETTVAVGGPLTATIDVVKNKSVASISLKVKGVDGLAYRVLKNGNEYEAPAPELVVKLKDGDMERRYAFSFG